jgi:hypothetical protein
MLRRGLDLEEGRALLDSLLRGLHAICRRAAWLAQDAPSDIADGLGELAVDADTLAAHVEVLSSRQRHPGG